MSGSAWAEDPERAPHRFFGPGRPFLTGQVNGRDVVVQEYSTSSPLVIDAVTGARFETGTSWYHGLPFITRDMITGNSVPGWSSEIDAWAADAVARGDVDELATFRDHAPHREPDRHVTARSLRIIGGHLTARPGVSASRVSPVLR